MRRRLAIQTPLQSIGGLPPRWKATPTRLDSERLWSTLHSSRLSLGVASSFSISRFGMGFTW